MPPGGSPAQMEPFGLASSHLVSRASFCSRLAWHTLQKEADIRFCPEVGQPQAPAALPPIPSLAFLNLIGA